MSAFVLSPRHPLCSSIITLCLVSLTACAGGETSAQAEPTTPPHRPAPKAGGNEGLGTLLNPETHAPAIKRSRFTTASGLAIEILTEGTGPMPKVTNRVVVHYRGTFPDGREFDSSYKRGQPATFLPSQVIQGWRETLLLMPKGSKWRVTIPSALGYGARGVPGAIPANATLVFEIELIDIL